MLIVSSIVHCTGTVLGSISNITVISNILISKIYNFSNISYIYNSSNIPNVSDFFFKF